MLRSLKELRGYTLLATNGEIGKSKDFLFDDRSWTVRYLVADTGKWLPGRLVLISPVFIEEPDRETSRLPIGLTRETIENSPALSNHEPVSRQNERKLMAYYNLQPYWVGPHLWGNYPTPAALLPRRGAAVEGVAAESAGADESASHHLRSADEVAGYHIEGSDQEIGHVDDFIADTGTWTIEWVVVDTRNWLPGQKVVLSPAWAESVSWSEKKIHVDLTAEQIKNSPEFDPSEPINIDPSFKDRLYDYYGRAQSKS